MLTPMGTITPPQSRLKEIISVQIKSRLKEKTAQIYKKSLKKREREIL